MALRFPKTLSTIEIKIWIRALNYFKIMHNLTIMSCMKIYSPRNKTELLFDMYNQSYTEHNLLINFRMA